MGQRMLVLLILICTVLLYTNKFQSYIFLCSSHKITVFIYNILVSSSFQSILLTNEIINYIKFTSCYTKLDSNLFLKMDEFLNFKFSFSHKN